MAPTAPNGINALRRSGYKPVYPWISPRALAMLNHAAAEHDMHPCQLAARILESVLDELDEAPTAPVLDT